MQDLPCRSNYEILHKTTLDYFLELFLSKCFLNLVDNFAKEVALRLDRRLSQEISSIIVDWHFYNYDFSNTFDRIGDGGGDMYDHGNLVRIILISVSMSDIE